MPTPRWSASHPRYQRAKRSKPWAIAWFVAASACFGGPVQGEGSAPLAMATRLIEENPTELEELEELFGAFPRAWMDGVHQPLVRTFESGVITRVEVSLSIDPFHEDPTAPNPSLDEWRIVFRDACPQIHRLLDEKLGPPSRSFYPLPHGVLAAPSPVAAPCVLAWRLFEPEHVPARTAAQTKALQTALVRFLSQRVTRSSIEQHFGPMAFDEHGNRDKIEQATWSLASRPAGTEDPDEVTFSFRRSLPATDGLLVALGFGKTVVVSFDVHMQSRQLVNRRRFAVPRVRGWEIRVKVADVGLERIQLENRWIPSPTWHAEVPRIIRIRMVKVGNRR